MPLPGRDEVAEPQDEREHEQVGQEVEHSEHPVHVLPRVHALEVVHRGDVTVPRKKDSRPEEEASAVDEPASVFRGEGAPRGGRGDVHVLGPRRHPTRAPPSVAPGRVKFTTTTTSGLLSRRKV